MLRFKKIFLSFFLCITLIALWAPGHMVSAQSKNTISFIILSKYNVAADIRDNVKLFAVTSTGKAPTWKSSNSKVASVKYGIVTAKRAGNAIITARTKDGVAACKVTVKGTKVTLNSPSVSIERGETFQLSARTSNHSEVTWKSSKRSIATVDKHGRVTGIKPGETIVTADADGTKSDCILTVKSPEVQLSKTNISLYRGQTCKISATVSSKVKPIWKTNKRSVATVDETGTVTAQKNGTTIITATVDGVKKTCNVTVRKPEIVLNAGKITLKKGKSTTITAKVSSGNPPVWSTSNTKIILVNSTGKITALKTGTAYVYAKEDGTKVKCTVKVTE